MLCRGQVPVGTCSYAWALPLFLSSAEVKVADSELEDSQAVVPELDSHIRASHLPGPIAIIHPSQDATGNAGDGGPCSPG